MPPKTWLYTLCLLKHIKPPFYLKYFLRIYLSKGRVRLMTCLFTDQNHLSGTSRHCFCVILSGDVNIVRSSELLLLSIQALSSCFYVCFILERNTGNSFFVQEVKFCKTQDLLCLQLNYEPTVDFRDFIYYPLLETEQVKVLTKLSRTC